jgi:ribulose-phosphate 3-epimerase
MPKPRRIAPSILAADFARLGSQVSEVVDAGARVIHVDIMDGHFVPPLSMGPQVLSALVELGLPDVVFDVHMMVERPERYIADFAKAGASSITVHAEATPHVNYAVQQIKRGGCRAGVAITPSTPAEVVRELLDDLDLVLCMSVNPGWGGQPFIPHTADKLARLRALLPDRVRLEVDGGVAPATARTVVDAGADLLVAGSHVFGADDPPAAYRELADAVGAA